jgi:hypothetical protein
MTCSRTVIPKFLQRVGDRGVSSEQIGGRVISGRTSRLTAFVPTEIFFLISTIAMFRECSNAKRRC